MSKFRINFTRKIYAHSRFHPCEERVENNRYHSCGVDEVAVHDCAGSSAASSAASCGTLRGLQPKRLRNPAMHVLSVQHSASVLPNEPFRATNSSPTPLDSILAGLSRLALIRPPNRLRMSAYQICRCDPPENRTEMRLRICHVPGEFG